MFDLLEYITKYEHVEFEFIRVSQIYKTIHMTVTNIHYVENRQMQIDHNCSFRSALSM